MVEKTEGEEEEKAPKKKEGGGGRFSLAPMSFDDVVDTLLGIAPEKPGKKKKKGASEGEGAELEEARPEE